MIDFTRDMRIGWAAKPRSCAKLSTTSLWTSLNCMDFCQFGGPVNLTKIRHFTSNSPGRFQAGQYWTNLKKDKLQLVPKCGKVWQVSTREDVESAPEDRKKQFSGFTSRCNTPREWQCCKAKPICAAHLVPVKATQTKRMLKGHHSRGT